MTSTTNTNSHSGDSAIIAAAIEGGAGILLSEDLTDKYKIKGIVIKNRFIYRTLNREKMINSHRKLYFRRSSLGKNDFESFKMYLIFSLKLTGKAHHPKNLNIPENLECGLLAGRIEYQK